jgi:hypothetical protein
MVGTFREGRRLRARSVTPILKQINADLFGVTADECGVTLDNTIKPFAGSSEDVHLFGPPSLASKL